MDLFFLTVGLLVLTLVALVLVLAYAFHLKSRFDALAFAKDSQSVKYGKLSEQWIPFSERFPYSKENFRFIGSPIDGIAFEDDRIVFVEFKMNSSSLSEKQKHIRDLVHSRRVEWFELNAK